MSVVLKHNFLHGDKDLFVKNDFDQRSSFGQYYSVLRKSTSFPSKMMLEVMDIQTFIYVFSIMKH